MYGRSYWSEDHPGNRGGNKGGGKGGEGKGEREGEERKGRGERRESIIAGNERNTLTVSTQRDEHNSTGRWHMWFRSGTTSRDIASRAELQAHTQSPHRPRGTARGGEV